MIWKNEGIAHRKDFFISVFKGSSLKTTWNDKHNSERKLLVTSTMTRSGSYVLIFRLHTRPHVFISHVNSLNVRISEDNFNKTGTYCTEHVSLVVTL